jgi:glyoxalase/bleomycin resistance protein/dioxygenase superfamily protein
MSRLFGEMRQIAFVVRDLDGALRHWSERLGVGPFYMMRDLVPDGYRYREKPAPAPKITLALGFSGEFQVELIAQHDDHPSAYRDFLVAGREGFHHVSSWLTRAEYDRERERIRGRGTIAIHEGAIPGSGIRFAYFATDDAPGGFFFEIAEVKEPAIYEMMMKIREAARVWDGSRPVRELAEL